MHTQATRLAQCNTRGEHMPTHHTYTARPPVAPTQNQLTHDEEEIALAHRNVEHLHNIITPDIRKVPIPCVGWLDLCVAHTCSAIECITVRVCSPTDGHVCFVCNGLCCQATEPKMPSICCGPCMCVNVCVAPQHVHRSGQDNVGSELVTN